MKFYVNRLRDYEYDLKVSEGQIVIGLFKQCKTEGRGNFCGFYASELYLDTELYAFYISEDGVYNPEVRIGTVTVLDTPIKFKEVGIGSHLWTKVVEADTIEGAIVLFRMFEWTDWCYLFDDPDVQQEVSYCPNCNSKPNLSYIADDEDNYQAYFRCAVCGLNKKVEAKGISGVIDSWNSFAKS